MIFLTIRQIDLRRYSMMKIEAKIFLDYMFIAFDFGTNRYCFDFELGSEQFEFHTLNKRFRKIYREEIDAYKI